MTKLSITTALILGTCLFAQAADDLASAFKEGKLDGRLRAQYFVTDWDDDTKYSATGFAVGGSLIYKTAPLYGFSFVTGLYTTQNPGGWTEAEDGKYANTSKDLFARGPGSAYSYGDGYAVLAQAYLQYDIGKSKIRAGRMLVTNPWMSPNDTKMIPIAYEGVDFVSNDVLNTTIQLDYIDKIKERGMDYFGNMAETLDTPTKISNYYDTGYGTATVRHGDAPNVSVVGVTNKSIDNLELQGWVMHWPDLIDHIRLEANYALEAGDVILGFGGLYMKQYDQGAGNIILPKANNYDSDNSVDTYLYALRATANYRAAKFLLATSHTDGGGDMIAPWRGFPTQGYTRSMTQTDWNANTTSYKAEFDYDCDAIVPGVSTMLSYAYYNRDPSKKPYQSMTDRAYGNGDTRQWNFDVVYKLSGSWKGTELKARLMDQNNEKSTLATAETSNREMRLEANYRF
jgi:hypothetical protein